jgi:hypothetical protein
VLRQPGLDLPERVGLGRSGGSIVFGRLAIQTVLDQPAIMLPAAGYGSPREPGPSSGA